jgi:hypothetical protein
VKGGIKTGDLRQIRVDGHSHSDGRDIVRFVQGRQRHQRLELGQEFLSDARRTGVAEPAMHDAMAERGEVSVTQPVPDPGQNRGQNLAWYARRRASQFGRRDGLTIDADGSGRRMRSDAIDHAPDDAPIALVDTEFQRGGTGFILQFPDASSGAAAGRRRMPSVTALPHLRAGNPRQSRDISQRRIRHRPQRFMRKKPERR